MITTKTWVRSGYIVTVQANKQTRRFFVWGTNGDNAKLRFSIASTRFGYANNALRAAHVEATFNPTVFADTNDIIEVA